ncbi:MAG: hypothetical protein OEM82_09395 [Acidobacteriota bacterium]|nr:hypothetical protein [Acidobacteriota bacterium]MDH3528876.1 hypothetical protein [Acidobacteriota bacterium]
MGSSRDDDGTHNANYILVQYDTLGPLTDVTLAIFNIDNFKIEKQADGRTRVGTIGFSFADDFGSGGRITSKDGTKGGHSHISLLEGKKWNLQNKVYLDFSSLCPKEQ